MKSQSSKFLTFFLILLIILDDSNAKQAQAISGESLNSINHLLNKTQEYLFSFHKKQPIIETKLSLSAPIVVAGSLCFIAAAISSAGGVGGGGLFIPILSIIAGQNLKTASSFSAFMVTGASIANVICNLMSTLPKFGGKNLIDFDIALLSQPSVLLGVSVGVICNVVFPEWLITVLFAVFLAWSTSMTFKNGVKRWKLETALTITKRSEELENGVVRDVVVNQDHDCVEEPLLDKEIANCEPTGLPWIKLGMLVLVWCSFCLLYLLRGNRYGEGILSVEPCGVGYWLLSALQIPLAIVYTAWILYRKENSQQQELNRKDIQEDSAQVKQSNKLMFPVMALLAGILGGVFGIGGGMLISPLLLQVGISPEVTSATCSFMVFFSSTMSAFEYLLLGMEQTDVAFVFATICFVASLIGLVVVQKAIQEYGRTSLIVLSVGTVLALSTVLMTSYGAIDVWRDYVSGEYMGFKLPC